MEDPQHDGADIGWIRAILTGVATVVTGFFTVVALPNLVIMRFDQLTTFTRSLIAAAVSPAAVIALAWVLRRLQARGLI